MVRMNHTINVPVNQKKSHKKAKMLCRSDNRYYVVHHCEEPLSNSTSLDSVFTAASFCFPTNKFVWDISDIHNLSTVKKKIVGYAEDEWMVQ